MDEKDREIIRLLQNGFPLDPEPFKVIGDKLWIDEMTVISRLARMSQEGIIRRIGTFFDSQKLGYQGVLAAMAVPSDKIASITDSMALIPNITHNYLREGTPNIWFTVVARNQEELTSILEQIKLKSGIQDILLFPSLRQFKVRTDMA
jgi:DNA-binding Lrp family transcriptional regulator